MLDFFMADQLCSQVGFGFLLKFLIVSNSIAQYRCIIFLVMKQVPMLRNLEYVACYYITGSFKNQDYGYCMRTKHYRDFAYAVSFLPYYWRAMQVYN